MKFMEYSGLKMVTIREMLEAREEQNLHPRAQLSAKTRGRLRPEKECELRTCYQRDRDRILHSKAFRRLKHKTQVFLSPTGDHYRTRLTHTLEVSQIARTIGKALYLNEDLIEAIALGHDIGHTPFGHSGEKALDAIVPGGFSHNKQSLRIVDKLARNGTGINLTWEVRDGILKHSKGRGEINIAMNKSEELPGTLEGKVVRIADIIAYINHDLDDAIRAGILKDNDIPSRFTRSLGETHSERIHAMVTDVVLETKLQDTKDIFLSAEMTEVLTELRDFLFDKVYESPTVQEGFDGAKKIIEELYFRFLEDDDLFYKEIGSVNNYSTRERIVCDFIAGMTDRYALELYKRVFLPRPWMRV